MISGGLVLVTFIATSSLLSFVAACMAEGWFKMAKDDALIMRIVTPLITAVLSFLGWIIWAVATNYPPHVPAGDVYSIGLFGPLWTALYIALGGTAIFGGVKLLGGVGNVLAKITGKVRGLFRRGEEKSEPAQQEMQAQSGSQTLSLDDIYAKFNGLKSLCQSLREQLKEGSSFAQLGTLMEELDKVRTAIDDENKKSIVPVLMSDYIGPVEQGLRAYERLLKRKVSTADSMLSEMHDKTLPLMLNKVQSIYGQIHVGDIAELSTVASKLEVARPLKVEVEAEAQAI